jgi:Uma2 family endonuclease
MIAVSQPSPMTVETYLVWEPQQEIRYEYVNGEVYAMTGGTVPHNDIAINLLTLVLPFVRSQGCRINMADVKLQISTANRYYYPDLMVSCHPQDIQARQYLQFPKLIVEVLSPKTADKDRTNKFKDYQKIPTLQEYLLIHSEQINVECYRRGEGKLWLYYPYDLDDEIFLETIGISLPIKTLYAGINLE